MSTQVQGRLHKAKSIVLDWLIFALSFGRLPGSVFDRLEDEMISDQTIVSARAEKREQAFGQRVVRGILTASMAAVLTLPSLAAWGWMARATSRSRGTPSRQSRCRRSRIWIRCHR